MFLLKRREARRSGHGAERAPLCARLASLLLGGCLACGGEASDPGVAGARATRWLQASASAEDRLEYRLELDARVAGLRLVEGTLELLDAEGTPERRLARPRGVASDGVVARGELSVLGCAVDEDPSPPWGRTPIDPGAASCIVQLTGASRAAARGLLEPEWIGTSSLSRARTEFASLTLSDGRVLVAGGSVDAEEGVADDAAGSGAESAELPSAGAELPSAGAELYDPATNSWAVTGSLVTARRAFTLTAHALDDGGSGALAVGGESSDGALASSELYDPGTGTWSSGPELPLASSGHAALALADGSILIAGGATSTRASWLAAHAARWQDAGELLASEPDGSLTLLDDGSALLVGPHAPLAQRFEPASRSWRASRGQPAVARAGHTATRLGDGRVLLVGGNLSQLVELYEPDAERFVFAGATSSPHVGQSATLLADGRVVVIGGVGSGAAGGVEILDPVTGTWVPGPGTAPTRWGHRAERLDDEHVLIIGGVDAAGADPNGGAADPRAPSSGLLASVQRLDATQPATTRSEYRLPPRLDPDITRSAITELWASVTRPATLVTGRRYPLLLFLHGNHATCGRGQAPRIDDDCTYTRRGSCPRGYVVVPNHRGYDYVSRELAARGFIVVSVNANRGLTCGDGESGDSGFNLARGRLLLEHLQQLSEWDRGVSPTPESLGVSLQGQLDFTQVGLMGHSRGGEGARAAYALYRDAGSPWPARIAAPLGIRGIFEIGPVDGQTSRVLNAEGTAWTVLLPMCDGDVSDLQGVKPFDRMLGSLDEPRDGHKSSIVAWGTNHNFFNTEWQESDAAGCENHRALFTTGAGVVGSAEQRQIGLRSLSMFFLANVGAEKRPALNELFDPASPLASGSRIDRAYTPSLRPQRGVTLEDFSGPSGVSAHGLPMHYANVSVTHAPVPEHDERLRSARIDWPATTPGDPLLTPDDRYVQLPFSAAPRGIDLRDYTHLEFSAARGEGSDLLEPTPLGVQLVNADGSLSDPLDAAAFGLRLDGPVGSPLVAQHVVLQTARIPLAAFEGADRSAVRGVRFSFPDPRSTRLYLTSVRASLGTARLSPLTAGERVPRAPTGRRDPIRAQAPATDASSITLGPTARSLPERSADGNRIVALRAVDNQRVEIELYTPRPFSAQGDQLVLIIGDVKSRASRHPDGSLSRVVFALEGPAFARARTDVSVVVRYATSDRRRWDFGTLGALGAQP